MQRFRLQWLKAANRDASSKILHPNNIKKVKQTSPYTNIYSCCFTYVLYCSIWIAWLNNVSDTEAGYLLCGSGGSLSDYRERKWTGQILLFLLWCEWSKHTQGAEATLQWNSCTAKWCKMFFSLQTKERRIKLAHLLDHPGFQKVLSHRAAMQLKQTHQGQGRRFSVLPKNTWVHDPGEPAPTSHDSNSFYSAIN